MKQVTQTITQYSCASMMLCWMLLVVQAVQADGWQVLPEGNSYYTHELEDRKTGTEGECPTMTQDILITGYATESSEAEARTGSVDACLYGMVRFHPEEEGGEDSLAEARCKRFCDGTIRIGKKIIERAPGCTFGYVRTDVTEECATNGVQSVGIDWNGNLEYTASADGRLTTTCVCVPSGSGEAFSTIHR